ncbi:unnamed protein product, partial [Adineta steineri]
MNRQDNVPISNQQPQRKKCHGNRQDQRFRRKCRAQGMNATLIEKKLARRKQIQNKKTSTKNNVTNTSNNTVNVPVSTMTNLSKRKRDLSLQALNTTNQIIGKSTSSISLAQPLMKKTKKENNKIIIDSSIIVIDNNIMNTNYRRPLYLIQSPPLLFKKLGTRLKYFLNKEHEQKFIYIRLDLFDQHYYLQVYQHLWQSYLDIGLQQHIWPDALYKMANTTTDTQLCHKYLLNYLEYLKKLLCQCQLELDKQSQTCPITGLSLEQIDHCLKEYVHSERNYLSTRNNNQLIKFKEIIHEKDLYKTIATYQLSINLTEYINKLITIRQQQGEIWKDYLMLEMRILCNFLPENFGHLEHFIGSIIYLPLNNDQRSIELKNKRYKFIQEAKRAWLNIFFNAYEYQLQKYEQQYENEFKQLEIQLLNRITIDGSSILNKINEYLTYRTNRLKQDILKKISSSRGILLKNRQRSSSTKNMIGVSPEPYLDLIKNPFNRLQWNQLTLGPSYIRLNQSAIRPHKQQIKEIEKEHKEIYNKIERDLIRNQGIPLGASVFKQYSTNLRNYLQHSYFIPLQYKDYIQAQQQARIATSIRILIQKQNLIIRLTDKGHNFYIGSTIDFEKKAQKFFSDTKAFKELSDNPFNEIFNKVIQLLNKLRRNDRIRQWHYNEMMPDRKKCELSHLYFNPKTHKDDIPVRPIENTIHASTTNISKFLDRILQPIFNDKCKDTIIIDGASLIDGLDKYTKKGLFKSSTLFCTFDIHNLYTMLPQEESLKILVEFLNVHGYTKVTGIDPITIKELASLVLQENVFVYGKKFYKQTTGGAMGSSFTLTLANIFMWKWQKEFVRHQDITCEFYGRYIDDIFMTWNRSEKELRKLLDQANTWHPNIRLDYKIGQSLPFLDVLLTNNNGILSTSVYHKPAAEPYVTPFISDHPRHVFKNIVQNALTKAVRYSSTYQAFQNEQLYIKLMLLYNGYPFTFIDQQFRKFSIEHISSSSSSPFLPIICNQQQFIHTRQNILRKPTRQQSQIAISIATTDLDNKSTNENVLHTTPILRTEANKDTQLNKNIIVHYTHEKRFHSFKRDMHRILDDTFETQLNKDIKLIVGNRNRRNTQNELIRKRPKKSLLQNRVPKNNFYILRNKEMAQLINGEIVLMSLLDSLRLPEGRKKHKTLQQKQRQWRKNQQRHQLNKDLSSLPKFTLDQPYDIIFINYMTAFFVLLDLIERVRRTKYFTIDTETDDYSKKPALIQLQLIHLKINNHFKEEEEAIKSTIIIFEMCQLPLKTSIIYPFIQKLFDVIFHPSNIFLT